VFLFRITGLAVPSWNMFQLSAVPSKYLSPRIAVARAAFVLSILCDSTSAVRPDVTSCWFL